MFQKFTIPKHSVYLPASSLISLSLSELSDEPSLFHSHPYTEIIIPQNNCGKLICNDKNINMIINNYYIIPSNISHCEINLNKANKAKYYAVKLSDEISKTNEYPLIIDLKQKYQELNAFLQNAFHSFDNNDKNYALLNLACFYIALIKEIEKLDIYNHTAQASDFIYSESTKEIEYYLSKNYKEDVKIENLAAQYNISHSTLIKKFKKDLGVTPKEYLLKKRLDVSEELLRTSNYTITQISNFCGFISPAYFSLMFKKRFGLTPKEYRRNKKLFRLS